MRVCVTLGVAWPSRRLAVATAAAVAPARRRHDSVSGSTDHRFHRQGLLRLYREMVAHPTQCGRTPPPPPPTARPSSSHPPRPHRPCHPLNHPHHHPRRLLRLLFLPSPAETMQQSAQVRQRGRRRTASERRPRDATTTTMTTTTMMMMMRVRVELSVRRRLRLLVLLLSRHSRQRLVPPQPHSWAQRRRRGPGR